MEFLTLIPFVIIAIFIFIVIAAIASTKCSSCGKWWAIKEISRQETNRQPSSKTVTRNDVRRDASGKVIEQVQRQELVQTQKITYEAVYKCKHCGNESRKTLVEEKEVASIPSASSMNAYSLANQDCGPETCNLCSGTGKQLTKLCSACGGDGKVVVAKPPIKCMHCFGRGRKFNEECADCFGTGWSNVVKV